MAPWRPRGVRLVAAPFPLPDLEAAVLPSPFGADLVTVDLLVADLLLTDLLPVFALALLVPWAPPRSPLDLPSAARAGRLTSIFGWVDLTAAVAFAFPAGVCLEALRAVAFPLAATVADDFGIVLRGVAACTPALPALLAVRRSKRASVSSKSFSFDITSFMLTRGVVLRRLVCALVRCRSTMV